MSQVESVVDWIIDGNVETFKADFSVVTSRFPDLSEDDQSVLKVIHDRGLMEWDSSNTDVEGQGPAQSARSYGW